MRNVSYDLLPGCFAFVLLVSGCGPTYQHVDERDLTSSDGLACSGYLAWNDEPVRNVFLVINGSGILSNASVHRPFGELITTHPIAYATYDKPGITAPFGDPGAVRRDAAIFERYTLGHGVECAVEALHWARERFGPSARLHLRGHSEGSLVALYTYERLLETDPEMAAAIGTLVVSGVSLEPLAEAVDRQLGLLPDGEEIRAALASCDGPLLAERLGISCAYLEDAASRPSGSEMFARLAARTAPARFFVFQGTEDWNTPVERVRALEAWNESEGHLGLEFHYYEGGHSGTDEVVAQMARVLTAIVSE